MRRHLLRAALKQRTARTTALAAGLLYLLVYAYTVGDVVLSGGGPADTFPSLEVVEDWPAQMLRARVPFVYEPVAALSLTPEVAFFLSPVNLLLGGVLAALLGLNLALSVYALKQPRACRRRPVGGLLAALPGLLLGFACCAPTLLLALGSAAASLTLGFIAVRSALYPLALAGMAVSLWLQLHRLRGSGKGAVPGRRWRWEGAPVS
jgi:hypothetical protein